MNLEVAIEPVPLEQKHVLGRLLQLYFYDFTEFLPLKLTAEGEYPYRYLDSYWAPEPGESRFAYFIRSGPDAELSGFAMVRVVNDVNVMAEFCVLRPYRRGGLGSAAVKLVFKKHPGRWLIHEVATNLPAQAFWRRVIGEVTNGRFEEETEPDGALAQRFELP
jgi:predicted acetyltransferase